VKNSCKMGGGHKGIMTSILSWSGLSAVISCRIKTSTGTPYRFPDSSAPLQPGVWDDCSEQEAELIGGSLVSCECPVPSPVEGEGCNMPGLVCGLGGALSCPLRATCTQDHRWRISCPAFAFGTDAQPCGCPHPQLTDIPSVQNVSARITNASSASQWVVTAGNNCMPIKIERAEGSEWVELPLAVDPSFSSPTASCCTAGGCDPFLQLTLAELQSGQVLTLPWDARAIVFSEDTFACSGLNPLHGSALQPVSPGSFRITVAFQATLGDSCNADAGMATCHDDASPFPYPKPFCGETVTGLSLVSQVFTLTDAAELTVNLELP
jgi:hypothetical protein